MVPKAEETVNLASRLPQNQTAKIKKKKKREREREREYQMSGNRKLPEPSQKVILLKCKTFIL